MYVITDYQSGNMIDSAQTRQQVIRALHYHGLLALSEKLAAPLPRYGRRTIVAMPIGRRSFAIDHR